jgi:hypothetical protein
MLAGIAYKITDVGHHARKNFSGICGERLHAGEKPRFAVFFSRFIHRFNHAIGKNEKQIARMKLRAAGWIWNFGFREERRPERQASGREPLNLAGCAA